MIEEAGKQDLCCSGAAVRLSGEIGAWLLRVMQGYLYLNYQAIPGNLERRGMLRAEVCRAWLRSFRRHSQRSRMT
ncbi:hypothetical protein CK489_16585 [Bradyrhizobium sp. UFLA03-84]|nr:hypothetical protein CK489_16585 [Bradyrhizobium sp. UFLA03-84]